MVRFVSLKEQSEKKDFITRLEPNSLSKKDKAFWDLHLNALVDAYERYALRVTNLKYKRTKDILIAHASDLYCKALLQK